MSVPTLTVSVEVEPALWRRVEAEAREEREAERDFGGSRGEAKFEGGGQEEGEGGENT